MSREKFLYLYREINPYNIPVLKEIVNQGFEVLVVHDTENKLTPYKVPELKHVIFLSRKNFNQRKLNNLIFEFNPCLAYVSDRTVPLYNRAAILLRKRLGIPIVSACDTQWHGGKQWINVLTSWFRHKRYFSHMIVAGMRQFEYAKKLGFSNEEILWPMNSANVDFFLSEKINANKFKKNRNFLFTGRFAQVKGIDILLKAWSEIQNKKGATLTLVGNGPLKDHLDYPDDVMIYDYLPHEELLKLAGLSSCFILPSVFEPWALVIHEFAAAGLPLIVTNACGATPHLVINNFNGFIINPGSVNELKDSILKIIEMPDDVLYDFAIRSREISKSITPKMVAYAITSVLNK